MPGAFGFPAWGRFLHRLENRRAEKRLREKHEAADRSIMAVEAVRRNQLLEEQNRLLKECNREK